MTYQIRPIPSESKETHNFLGSNNPDFVFTTSVSGYVESYSKKQIKKKDLPKFSTNSGVNYSLK